MKTLPIVLRPRQRKSQVVDYDGSNGVWQSYHHLLVDRHRLGGAIHVPGEQTPLLASLRAVLSKQHRVMRIHTFIFALVTALICGCATEHFSTSHGDIGQFILQQVIRYGGSPTNTNGLPVVTSSWRYVEDEDGMQIHLPADAYSNVEAFLNQAFAGKRQYGPAGSADLRTRDHEYSMSTKGGGILLSEENSDTLVLVLRPFGVSK